MATEIDNNSQELISSDERSNNNKSQSSSPLKINSAHASKQGRRPTLEDTIVSISNFKVSNSKCTSGNHALYAVFDGHGNDSVSKACVQYLPEILSKCLQSHNNINQALNECIKTLDETIINNIKYSNKAGAVAIISLIDIITKQLWVTNVGDCRCIIITENKGVSSLSKEHRPYGKELKRIEDAGGFVNARGYVMNVLQMTRVIGDADVKNVNPNVIICKPDIQSYQLTLNDKYLILGCDGLWDVMSNDDVENYVLSYFYKHNNNDASLQDICDKLTNDAIEQYKSMDNVSVVIIQLHDLD
jgi:protein phosphatase 2C family protein 2/3